MLEVSANHFARIDSANRSLSTKNVSVRNNVAVGSQTSFALLDTETTGVHVHKDRIIEIAIVRCDSSGRILDEYCTLINPNRDLGPQHIHGISAADATLAPTFAEVIGDVIDRLYDSVVVGHNVRFDLQLLRFECERLNIVLPEFPSICTMSLASEASLGCRKLVDCCARLGIDLGTSHSALDDAKSTLKLFAELKQHFSCSELIEAEMDKLAVPSVEWPNVRPTGKVFQRRTVAQRQPHYLKNLIASLPETGSSETTEYAATLDRALEDRIITEEEYRELLDVTRSDTLSKSAVVNTHVDYLRTLMIRALADGCISPAEHSDLQTVTHLVGLGEDVLDSLRDSVEGSAAPEDSGCIEEFRGKRVCFTGAQTCTINGELISRERALEFATEKGLVATDSITKKTDILVLADPSSMSGKANKARQYGVRLMSDRVFWQSIGIPID